jgi:AMIN domain
MSRLHERRSARALMIVGRMVCLLAATVAIANDPTTIRRIAVLGGASFEVEITASQPITPEVHVITGPDRLVIDFPNALPENGLHNISVNRGEVKGIRVGVFSKSPPVTRVVVDLNRAQPYQLFPSGKTVIVKLGSGGSAKNPPAVRSTPHRSASMVPASYSPPKPAPKVEVSYENGRLSIRAEGANLAEVLYELQRKTGADIPIPAGAEQEKVVASLGPGPAAEVLATLLNGSRFNFIVVSSSDNPAALKSLILTERGEGVSEPVITYSGAAAAQPAPEPEPPPQAETQPEPQPAPGQPQSQPEPQGPDSPPQ